jgi:hypothetical protein
LPSAFGGNTTSNLKHRGAYASAAPRLVWKD